MSGSDLTMSTAISREGCRQDQTANHGFASPLIGDAPLGTPIDTIRRARRRPHRPPRSTEAATDFGQPDALLERRRLATDDHDAVDLAAQSGEHVEHHGRAHAVRVEGGRRIVTAVELGDLGLEQGHGARRLAHRHRVDEHERRRSRRAARRRGARRGCRSPRRARRRGRRAAAQSAGDLDAEAVVAQEDVADAGHEHAAGSWPASAAIERRVERLDLVGMEEQVAALPRAALRSRGRRRSSPRRASSPSTSWKTPATVASSPARNMSCASARRDGRRRTLVPVPTSTPRPPRCRSTGRPQRRPRVPPRQRRLGSGDAVAASLARASELAHRAVQARPHFGRHVVACGR